MILIIPNSICGFRPGTVNIFRKMVVLPEAAYSKQEDDKPHLHSSSNIKDKIAFTFRNNESKFSYEAAFFR